MAKRTSKRNRQQILMEHWWVRLVVALAFLGLAYGFGSLALDSAHLWEYALAILFIWFGIKQAVTAIRFAFFT